MRRFRIYFLHVNVEGIGEAIEEVTLWLNLLTNHSQLGLHDDTCFLLPLPLVLHTKSGSILEDIDVLLMLVKDGTMGISIH